MPWWMEEVQEALELLKAGNIDEAIETLNYLVTGSYDDE